MREIVANTFWKRLVGLIFWKKSDGPVRLIIPRCNAIHTCFMRRPVDVYFMDKDDNTMMGFLAVPPWRILYYRGAVSVHEELC